MNLPPAVLLILVFAALIGLIHLGGWLGRKLGRVDETDRAASAVEGAVFALVAFLLAFAFGGAQERLQNRTFLIVAEANAIGTYDLRTDLVRPSERRELRGLLLEYLDHRIEGASKLPDTRRAREIWARADQVGARLWDLTLSASTSVGDEDRSLVIQSLNEVFDTATARSIAAQIHVPPVILVALCFLTALAALLAGRTLATGGRQGMTLRVVLSLVFAIVITLLVDLDYPRAGLIRVSASDQALESVRTQIQQRLDR